MHQRPSSGPSRQKNQLKLSEPMHFGQSIQHAMLRLTLLTKTYSLHDSSELGY